MDPRTPTNDIYDRRVLETESLAYPAITCDYSLNVQHRVDRKRFEEFKEDLFGSCRVSGMTVSCASGVVSAVAGRLYAKAFSIHIDDNYSWTHITAGTSRVYCLVSVHRWTEINHPTVCGVAPTGTTVYNPGMNQYRYRGRFVYTTSTISETDTGIDEVVAETENGSISDTNKNRLTSTTGKFSSAQAGDVIYIQSGTGAVTGAHVIETVAGDGSYVETYSEVIFSGSAADVVFYVANAVVTPILLATIYTDETVDEVLPLLNSKWGETENLIHLKNADWGTTREHFLVQMVLGTGTVAITGGSGAIVGTGTDFTDLNEGTAVVINGTETVVVSITDATHMTVMNTDWGVATLTQRQGYTWYYTTKRAKEYLYPLKPNAPVLVEDNFKVVRLNDHMTQTADVAKIQDNINLRDQVSASVASQAAEQQELRTRLTEIMTEISSYDGETTDAAYTNLVSQASALRSQISTLATNITSDRQSELSLNQGIQNLSGNILKKAPPKAKHRIMGSWEVPAAVGGQEVIGFVVRYQYLDLELKPSADVTSPVINASGNTIQQMNFSSYSEIRTNELIKTRSSTTGFVSWGEEHTASSEEININQIMIPVTPGEAVRIQVATYSEADTQYLSDWSNSIVIKFELDEVVDEVIDLEQVYTDAISRGRTTDLQGQINDLKVAVDVLRTISIALPGFTTAINDLIRRMGVVESKLDIDSPPDGGKNPPDIGDGEGWWRL